MNFIDGIMKSESSTADQDLTRCEWAGTDALMIAYHDQEWGLPVHDDRRLFEFLILEGMQAGLSWMTILRKRENFRAAFDDFDVEKVAQAFARTGVEFAQNNPVTYLMTYQTTGKLNSEILSEKVCSAMIETITPLENFAAVIKELKEVAQQIDTVFSLTVSTRLEPDGSAPCLKVLSELDVPWYINGKTNVGLGRPLFEEISS